MNFKSLIYRLRKGEETAFKELVFSYSKRLLTVCKIYAYNQSDAQDLLQDALIVVFQKVKSFKGEEEKAFYAWMRQIIIYQAFNKNQKKYLRVEKSLEEFPNDPVIEPEGVSKLSHEEIVSLVMNLPSGYKQVFALFAIEGFSHKEIANRMNIKESSSRSQYVRARKILQQKINELSKIRI